MQQKAYKYKRYSTNRLCGTTKQAVLLFTFMLFGVWQMAAQEQKQLSLRQRINYKTNMVDWAICLPNVGIEFDLGNQLYSKHSLGLNLKYNPNTHHSIAPSHNYNVLDARIEWRQYFRTRPYKAAWRDDDKRAYYSAASRWLKNRGLTGERKHPRIMRAYYWGIYAEYTNYDIRLWGDGTKGPAYGLGLSVGYSKPLYGYGRNHRKSYVELELGASACIIFSDHTHYNYNRNTHSYFTFVSGTEVIPMITDLRVAFVFRKASVAQKYQKSEWRKKERYIQSRKDAIKAEDNMRYDLELRESRLKREKLNVDSVFTVELKPDELRLWQRMKAERMAAEKRETSHQADTITHQPTRKEKPKKAKKNEE